MTSILPHYPLCWRAASTISIASCRPRTRARVWTWREKLAARWLSNSCTVCVWGGDVNERRVIRE